MLHVCLRSPNSPCSPFECPPTFAFHLPPCVAQCAFISPFVSGIAIACLSDTLALRCLVCILHLLNKPLTGDPRMSGPIYSGFRDVRPCCARPPHTYSLPHIDLSVSAHSRLQCTRTVPACFALPMYALVVRLLAFCCIRSLYAYSPFVVLARSLYACSLYSLYVCLLTFCCIRSLYACSPFVVLASCTPARCTPSVPACQLVVNSSIAGYFNIIITQRLNG